MSKRKKTKSVQSPVITALYTYQVSCPVDGDMGQLHLDYKLPTEKMDCMPCPKCRKTCVLVEVVE
jgi:hypothetical protein